jgi:SAM-dependent methyltransferase
MANENLLFLGLLAMASCAAPGPGPTSDERGSMHQHGNHNKALDDPGRDAWQRPDEVVAAVALVEGMVVADVGAGTGYLEPHLSRAVGGRGKVLALDIDPDLVAHMQRRFDQARLGNIEARLVSPADPGLPAGGVDRVLIVDVWHHMSDRVAYARKLRTALTPTGRVVIVDYPIDAPEGPPAELRVSPEAVMADLEAAGFIARIEPEALPRQFIVVGELGR